VRGAVEPPHGRPATGRDGVDEQPPAPDGTDRVLGVGGAAAAEPALGGSTVPVPVFASAEVQAASDSSDPTRQTPQVVLRRVNLMADPLS
jgi:hypothetical protein